MTKQLLPYLLTVLMSILGLNAFAYDIAVKNADGVTIYYNWNKDKTELGVTYLNEDANSYHGIVVIPESVKYEGKVYSVTSIGYGALGGCSGLTSVTIPNSVIFIGDEAFAGCSSLTSITIPNVCSIGKEAFYNCSSLTSITIPNGCRIGKDAFGGFSGLTSITLSGRVSCDDRAFSGCSNLNAVHILDLEAFLHSTFELEDGPSNPLFYAHHLYLNGEEIKVLVIPNTITQINDCVFMGCSDLTSVTIPNSVTSIGRLAFYGCSGLTSVFIPNSVTSIGSSAFADCSGLSSVTIPNSVTSIGSAAFSGCSGLASIKVERGNEKYDSRNNCNAIIETSSNILIAGCKNTIIPNSVTSIGNYAFQNCSGLTSVTIGNSVTSIGGSAFSGCGGLTSVNISNSVTSIGGSAFYGCSGLTTVISQIEKPFEIVSYTFSDDTYNVAELIVPKGTKAAYQSTEGWNKFQNIVEASGGEEPINNPSTKYSDQYLTFYSPFTRRYTFNGTKGNDFIQYSINFGDWRTLAKGESVHVEGGDDVRWAGNLTPDPYYGIGNFVDGGEPFEVYGNIMSLLYGDDFIGKTSLDGKEDAFRDLFSDCADLVSAKGLVLPATTLADRCYYRMFINCTSLTTAPALPATTMSYGCYCSMFENCKSLTTAPVLPATTLAESCYSNMFDGCRRLTTAPDLPATKLVNGCYNSMFAGCSSINHVKCLATDLGANSTTGWLYGVSSSGTFVKSSSMNDWARGESGIPEGWTIQNDNESSSEIGQIFEVDGIYYKIGENNTVSVTYGEVKYSGDVVIPESVKYGGKTYNVTSIGINAFIDSDLISITIPSSITFIDEDAFRWCDKLNSVYISDLSAWCKMKFKLGSPDNPNPLSYAHHLFLNGKEIKDLVIPNDVTSIPFDAFYGCSAIASVKIPNSVTSIGYDAFTDCKGLITITSEIEKPFEIDISTFDSDTYTVAELIVPYGTKAAYQATEGWNKFAKITEAEEESDEFEVDGIYYRKLVNNTASVIKGSNEYFGDVVIPSQVKYKGHTYSVTIIERAFEGCANLTSVTIPNRVILIYHYAFEGCDNLKSVYISDLEAWCNVKFEEGFVEPLSSNPLRQAHHLFLNGIEVKDLAIPQNMAEIKYATFQGCSGLTSVLFPEGVTSIGSCAFYDCKGLTSLLLPNSVTSIGWHAFSGCSGLTSVTIPNSVTSIGFYAFSDCTGLTTITSEIQQPFKIDESVFSSVTYSLTELIVPKGTKALYQATEGWNKFAKITEAGDKDEVLFTIDGVTYQGSKPEKNVTVKSVDASKTWMEIPASVSYDGITYQVTGIENDVFKGNSLAALIWDVEAVLPNNAFSNASIGSNFLLYVKSSSYAPSSVKNVVVNGTAQTIVLSDDGGQFYCPQAFTARSISYTHNYSMETDIGKAKGWETLALPFDVQKILHSTRGEIVPFPSYNSSSTQKPFWLANFSGNGFRRTAAVLANEPYIIAMPNSSSYRNEYNLAGDVTFSADNVQVPKTPSFSGTFVPAFATVAKSSSVYALNVNNRNVKYSGSYDAGSRFISGLRDVHPFEAYMTGGSSTRGVIEISFDDGATDMLDILLPTDESQEVTIHTLSGQQIICTTQRDFDAVWQQLPKGVYIINGKKWIK